MLDIQNYASFISAIIVFRIVPGAGTIKCKSVEPPLSHEWEN
jgi:hypothetical protein